jgi:hypothetical protein
MYFVPPSWLCQVQPGSRRCTRNLAKNIKQKIKSCRGEGAKCHVHLKHSVACFCVCTLRTTAAPMMTQSFYVCEILYTESKRRKLLRFCLLLIGLYLVVYLFRMQICEQLNEFSSRNSITV